MTIIIYEIGATWNNDDGLVAIDKHLSDGYTVLNVSTYAYDGEVTQRWTLRKDENAAAPQAAATVKTDIRAVVSIECRESYSKTARQNFKFFTCVMENGEKVNIFDHPDSSRNTFKIAENAGWFHLSNLEVGDLRNYDPALPITVTHDGEWYSLVNIMHHDLYLELAYEAPEREPQDATPDDIRQGNDKWYHESPDDPESVKVLRQAIDDIRQGISLDDDDETDASDNAAAEDKSFVAHDDAVSNGCTMCGNEWQSLNQHGRCSHCEQVWNS